MTNNDKKYYTQTEVKALGFSNSMIQQLLPKPILKQNPYYKSASPMKLWECDAVDTIIKSQDFIELKNQNVNRRLGARKAVKTKQQKLHEEILNKINEIKVKRLSFEELQNRTIREKQNWYDYQSYLRGNCIDYSDAATADSQTQYRWMVNYARHNLTSYDEILYAMSGKVGCHTEYHVYRDAVLDKIAQTYPELAYECEIQKTKL